MYIELLGLPASGKSTIMSSCKTAAKEAGMEIAGASFLQEKDSNNREIPPNIRKHIQTRYLFRDEAFRLKYDELAKESDILFGANLPARTFYYMNAAEYMSYRANETKKTIRLVDEGFLHRGIYGIARETQWDEARIIHWLNLTPPMDCVLYTKLDPSFGYERVRARLYQRHKDKRSPERIEKLLLSAHGDEAAFKKRSEIMDLACQVLQDKGVLVQKIDTSCTIEETQNQTQKAIKTAISKTENS